jgi:hypothetical protein
MNAAEQAAADAKLITPDAIEAIEDGSAINSENNRAFVRSFVSKLLPAERGGALDAQGNLSQAGVRRLEAAVSARAYGDGDFISRAFDAADPNIRGLAAALTDGRQHILNPRLSGWQAAKPGSSRTGPSLGCRRDHDCSPRDKLPAAGARQRLLFEQGFRDLLDL